MHYSVAVAHPRANAMSDRNPQNANPDTPSPRQANRFTKPVILLIAIAAFYFVSQKYGDQLTIQSLAAREVALSEY